MVFWEPGARSQLSCCEFKACACGLDSLTLHLNKYLHGVEILVFFPLTWLLSIDSYCFRIHVGCDSGVQRLPVACYTHKGEFLRI